MKNKVIYFLLATSLTAFLLVGCGAENTTTPSTESNDTSIAEAVEPTEELSTEEQTEPEEMEQPTKTVEEAEEPEYETEVVEESTEEVTEPVVEEPTFTYTDLSQTMYAKQSVNVRSLPSTDGEKLGGLSTAQEVTVTGQCNETSWYRIDYNGSVGYVSNNYLVTEKPVVEEKPAEKPVQPSGNWYDDYEKYVWYDMGNYFFIITGSEDETHGYVFSEEATGYRKILEERYPDRNVYQAGEWSYNAGGVPVGTITALHVDPETGFPMWEEAGYIWD